MPATPAIAATVRPFTDEPLLPTEFVAIRHMPTYLGVDPGSRNCGIAIIDDDFRPLMVDQLDPAGDPFHAALKIADLAEQYGVVAAAIERMVPYRKVVTAEGILLLTGALANELQHRRIDTRLFRSADWPRLLATELELLIPGYSAPKRPAKIVAQVASTHLLGITPTIPGAKRGSQRRRPHHQTDAAALAAYIRILTKGRPIPSAKKEANNRSNHNPHK